MFNVVKCVMSNEDLSLSLSLLLALALALAPSLLPPSLRSGEVIEMDIRWGSWERVASP